MVKLVCSIWANKFFVILLLSKTPPPSARSPRRRPLRHGHRSRCHQTVLPLQLRLPERNHQKTDDHQPTRWDQRVSRADAQTPVNHLVLARAFLYCRILSKFVGLSCILCLALSFLRIILILVFFHLFYIDIRIDTYYNKGVQICRWHPDKCSNYCKETVLWS